MTTSLSVRTKCVYNKGMLDKSKYELATERIDIRVTSRAKDSIEEWAKKEGLTVAKYLILLHERHVSLVEHDGKVPIRLVGTIDVDNPKPLKNRKEWYENSESEHTAPVSDQKLPSSLGWLDGSKETMPELNVVDFLSQHSQPSGPIIRLTMVELLESYGEVDLIPDDLRKHVEQYGEVHVDDAGKIWEPKVFG